MAEKKKWKKAPQDLIDKFYDALDECTRKVERRMMFGYPCAFINTNMFTGIHEDHLVVRLSEVERDKLISDQGVKQFEPFPGRVMKEYIVVPEEIINNKSQLIALFMLSIGYVKTLPSKKPKR